MLLDLTLLLLLALLLNVLVTKAGLPGLLGFIAAGVLAGPSCLDRLEPEIVSFLSEFKTVALIVILIRAGLGINRDTLKKIGAPAIKMSFVPGVLEGTAVMLAARTLLGFGWIEGGMLGFIIAAVSPAVVVPTMLDLKDSGFGKKKEIPTLVLAGASVDDVFAITVFGVFVGLATGGEISIASLVIKVPLGIIGGALIGAFLGWVLLKIFQRFRMRDTRKLIFFMMVAVLFFEGSELPTMKQILPIAGLLGIMAMGFVLLELNGELASRLASKFGKVWVLSEILLFVYIGTQVDLRQIPAPLVGLGLLILVIGIAARSAGVFLSLAGSELNREEKLFCAIAYWPKATVQAAIGATPLTLIHAGKMPGVDLQVGQSILAIAVLSIIVTAPIGAIGIKAFGPRLLASDTTGQSGSGSLR